MGGLGIYGFVYKGSVGFAVILREHPHWQLHSISSAFLANFVEDGCYPRSPGSQVTGLQGSQPDLGVPYFENQMSDATTLCSSQQINLVTFGVLPCRVRMVVTVPTRYS